MTDDRMTRSEWQQRLQQEAAERALAAKRIDPITCERWKQFVDLLDIYGGDPDPDHLTSFGWVYFVCHPDGGAAVAELEVRLLHPEISNFEWSELMVAADYRCHRTDEASMTTAPSESDSGISAAGTIGNKEDEKARFDPEEWDGDPDRLPPADELTFDYELCERTFSSRQEAFQHGLGLGQK